MAKHAGPSKAGKNAEKCKRYRAGNRRVIHKLARIRQSNGNAAAMEYDLAAARGDISGIRFPRTRGPVPLWQILANAKRDPQHNGC
jgi:hypothetical protein